MRTIAIVNTAALLLGLNAINSCEEGLLSLNVVNPCSARGLSLPSRKASSKVWKHWKKATSSETIREEQTLW